MAQELTIANIPHHNVGPMALRTKWRAVTRFNFVEAAVNDTNFIFPTYRPGILRNNVGPIVLRKGRRAFFRVTAQTYTISGTTKDSAGVALPSCTLHFFQAATPFGYLGSATSDGSGNYTFNPPGGDLTSADAYLVGSPDVAGRSINGLTITVNASS